MSCRTQCRASLLALALCSAHAASPALHAAPVQPRPLATVGVPFRSLALSHLYHLFGLTPWIAKDTATPPPPPPPPPAPDAGAGTDPNGTPK
jgi:hypothetical protein